MFWEPPKVRKLGGKLVVGSGAGGESSLTLLRFFFDGTRGLFGFACIMNLGQHLVNICLIPGSVKEQSGDSDCSTTIAAEQSG